MDCVLEGFVIDEWTAAPRGIGGSVGKVVECVAVCISRLGDTFEE